MRFRRSFQTLYDDQDVILTELGDQVVRCFYAWCTRQRVPDLHQGSAPAAVKAVLASNTMITSLSQSIVSRSEMKGVHAPFLLLYSGHCFHHHEVGNMLFYHSTALGASQLKHMMRHLN